MLMNVQTVLSENFLHVVDFVFVENGENPLESRSEQFYFGFNYYYFNYYLHIVFIHVKSFFLHLFLFL